MVEEIKAKIEAAVPQAQAFVIDPMNDGQHLQAFVVSQAFEGLPVFKQHQMVMVPLKETFETLHALGLKTFTPAKWNEVKGQYGF